MVPGTVAVRCSPRQAPGREIWFPGRMLLLQAQWYWAVVSGRFQADSYGSRLKAVAPGTRPCSEV